MGHPPIKNISGQPFGRLTALDRMSGDAELDDMTAAQKHIVAAEHIRRWESAPLLRLAKARGLDMSPPTITPEQIIQAALAPPASKMIVTNDTTDEELSAFIRGKHRRG